MTGPVLRRKLSDDEYEDYPIDAHTVTIGRSKECQIALEDSSISRLHLRLENRNGTIFAIDNNSANGTFLNKKKITEAPLIHGDALVAGRVAFEFRNENTLEGNSTAPMPILNDVEQTRPMHVPDFVSEDDMTPPPPPPPTPPMSKVVSKERQLETAPPLKRLLAILIDSGLVLVLSIPGTVLSMFSATLGGLFSLLVFAAAIAHPIVGWLKYGKTLGKHLLGLQIIAVDRPHSLSLPPETVVKRMAVYMASSFLFGLPFLLIFKDPEGRAPHDKIAGTRVIISPRPDGEH